MTSQITSDNIDAAFPVAGKDNDSQGFRDNFSAIKTNFVNAKAEIEALQTKAVLSSPLDGVGTTTNNLGGSNINNGTYTNFRGTAWINSDVSGSSNIDYLKGDLQSLTLSTDSTLTFQHWPQDGEYAKMRIHLRSSSSPISVGNDIIIGRRYSIETIENTNYIDMGAAPTATINCRVGNEAGSSAAGNILHVESIEAGTIGVGTFLIVDTSGGGSVPNTSGEIAAFSSLNGVQVIATTEDPTKFRISATGQITSTTRVFGVTRGLSFIASSKGTGTGTVRLWKQVTFASENGGTVTPASNFSLPLELNPNETDQVLDAWTFTGQLGKKVYLDYVANLDTEQTNYTDLQTGTLTVDNDANSIDFEITNNSLTGAVKIAGGMSVAKDINVGDNVIVNKDLTVRGTLTVTNPPAYTVGNLSDIGDVVLQTLQPGDNLRYDGTNWTNTVDIVSYDVSVADDGSNTQNVFWLRPHGTSDNPVPLSDNAGNQLDLKFQIGKRYRFYQGATTVWSVTPEHPSGDNNANFPLFFSTTPDTVTTLNNAPGGSVTPYNPVGYVVSSGTPGTAGAYIEIHVTEDTPSPIYLYAKQIGGTQTDKVGAQFPVQVSDGPVRVVSDYSPKRSQTILVDTADNAVTITLPSGSYSGTTFTIVDAGNASTNPITIDPNGANINGSSSNAQINGSFGGVILTYNRTTGWTSLPLSYNGSDELSGFTSYDISSSSATAPTSWYTAVTYFNPGAPWNASLTDGIEGQTKTFIQTGGSGGSLVLTVSSAGWKSGGGSGTITFDNVGDSATLRFVNGLWHIVANVNAVADVDGGISPAFLVSTPNALNAPGTAGRLSYDGSSFYVCTSTDTWGQVIFDNVAGTTRATYVSVPLSANSSGSRGQMAADSAYLYICIATNTWKRIAWTAGW